MSQLVTFNGTAYLIPTTGETTWGTTVTNFLADVGTNAIVLTANQTLSNKTLALNAGLVGAPSVAFAADAASGLYQPALHQVALATAGVQRLLIDGSGNVTVAGATTISSGGVTLTAGNLTLSSGSATLTSGNLTLTAGNLTLSAGNASVTGNLTVTGSFPVAPNIGRNKIHNPIFVVQQRGVGPFTANNAYTADRWCISFVNGTSSVTMPALADADRTAIGDEEAAYALQNTFVGTSAAGDETAIFQGIEGVRRLAGKTITVSFWAKCASGTPKLGVSLDQVFGSGGSPSAQVNGTGQSVTLSSTWTRYTLTYNIPSTAGKTLGTNGDDRYHFLFWFSAGSTNATRSGTVGVQSGTFQIWGVQLEIEAFVTPLEKRDLRLELTTCRRFYRTGSMQMAGYNQASGLAAQMWDSPDMRAVPTVTPNFTTNSNCSGSSLQWTTAGPGLQIQTTVTGTGNFNAAGTYTASADY